MSADKSFRGTLLLLQNKTKRDPESYVDEFRTQLRYFDAVVSAMLTGGKAAGAAADVTSISNPQFLAVMQFVCHVAYCYPKECSRLSDQLIALLKHGKETLNAESRIGIVNSLLLLRNKNLCPAEKTMPVLFELLETRDKTLRKIILAHIVSDVRRINLPGSKEGSSNVNKQIQNFLFKVMEDDDAVQARSALVVMIDLYRRQLWCNEKTVQVISKACFSRHTLIIRMALHFFLMQMPKFSSVGSDEDEEDEIDPGRLISRLKHKLKHKAKTVKRERVLKDKVDKLKRRFDKDRNEAIALEKQHVDPVRLLQDPQGFAERLLARLHKTTERFEVRILFMSVLARVISEHELVLLGVFPLFERYLEPTQLHATNILALASTCVHPLVPPDALESFIRTIADRFVNDRSDRDSITIGINTIREICKRQPLAMNADLLADLVSYKQRRGEKGVIMAARALLQLYREVNPELLPAKLRGSRSGAPGDVKAPQFGASKAFHDIPGLEGLFGADDGDNADAASATSSSNVHFSLSDESGDDGEWELVTDDSEGEFSESNDEAEDEDGDHVPQLVAVQPDKVKPTSTSDREGKANRNPKRLSEQGTIQPSGNAFVVADDMWEDSDADAPAKPADKSHRTESRHTAVKPPASDDDSDDQVDEESDDEAESGEWEEADENDSDEDTDEEGDEDDSDGSSEWINVTDSDEEAASGPAHEAPAKDEIGWIDDVKKHPGKAAAASTTGMSSVGKQSVASMRTLTDEEFAKLRLLREGKPVGKAVNAKELDKQKRMSRKDALVHDLGQRGQLLEASTIETYTDKKRSRDRDKKIEEAQQKRLDNNPFQARKKKKTKLTTTHREKQKAGKLYQMTKRSSRVALKLKRSVQDRGEHAKDMKKKSIKFRIARGWKA
jgi:protein SDA1